MNWRFNTISHRSGSRRKPPTIRPFPIAPFTPVPDLFEEEEPEQPVVDTSTQEAPERPVMTRPAMARSRATQPRMPKVEEFPAIAQDEMRHKASAGAEEGDKGCAWVAAQACPMWA